MENGGELNNYNYGERRGGVVDSEEGMEVVRKRVMVVVDESSGAKVAMMWALTHVANTGDRLTLLSVVDDQEPTSQYSTWRRRTWRRRRRRRRRDHDQYHYEAAATATHLANSLASLCKASKHQVDVEALVVRGPKLASTVLSQVKKLEVTVLVLSQYCKPHPLSWRLFKSCCCCSTSHELLFVEQCINNAECLAMAVRKQRKGLNGYLVTTRFQNNFWLLA